MAPRLRRLLADSVVRAPRRLPGSAVLALFLLVLAVASTPGEWLVFPLRASLRARDLHWVWNEGGRELSLAKLFPALAAAGLVLTVVSRPAAIVSLCAALVLVLSVPVETAAFRVGLLEAYVRESSERAAFTAYSSAQFVANVSPEPAFTSIGSFEDAGEQLAIGFAMLGWGWYIAAAAALSLLLIVARGWTFQRRTLAVAATLGLFALAATAPAARVLIESELAQNEGDRLLVRGEGSAAMSSYERALTKNPALAVSTPFLKKSAMALRIASGGRHALGSLSQDLDLLSRRSEEGIEDVYPLARQRLLEATFMTASGRPLEASLRRAAIDLQSELWRSEGIARANQHRYVEALGAHLKARTPEDSIAAFYLAHTYLALGIPQPAVEVFSRLEQQVANRSIRADLRCSLGDAYTVQGDLTKARDAYRGCRELDKIENYRAFKALTGS